MAHEKEDRRDESELERIDRNMLELLNELRVALPGVQVLFAFLLVLPFNQGFEDVSSFQKNVYLVTLLTTALSAVLLIAPSMVHRLQFREDNKEQILRDSQRLTIAGMSVLALAMCGAVTLVADFVFGKAATIASVTGVALAILVFWYSLPSIRLRQKRQDD